MSSSRKTPLWFIARLLVFAVLLGIVSEVWFRTITPASELPVSYIDPATRIDRFYAEGPSEGVTTIGRLARHGGDWRVNNMGWLSDVDYQPPEERSKPLIAVFGDSYIEGFLTDLREHVDVVLRARLDERWDVYAFGKSGWYLEQYVAVARYARDSFKPDIMVIFVNGEDVQASLRENGVRSSKWFQLSTASKGFEELPPSQVEPSMTRLKIAVTYSATARYLLHNAKVEPPWGGQPGIEDINIRVEDDERRADVAEDPQVVESAIQALVPAATFMLDTLTGENPGVPIIVVGDGPRYLSADEAGAPITDPDIAAIQSSSAANPSCHFLDLRRVFSADWDQNHQRFEGIDTNHWNAYGNQVVANALAQFLASEGLLD